MKKILFATSALAAVAFAGSAQASEPIKLSVGGYMEQWAGFSDEDTPSNGGRRNAFQSDTEIHFKGSTTLDNGVEVGAVVELEGETSSDQVDEQYLYINGGFGRVEFGKNDSAADAMGITAPAVGPVGVNDGDLTEWANVYLPDTVPSSGDQNRITYFTPVVGGFRAGISFADDSGRNGVFDRNVNGGAIGGLHSDTTGSGDNIVSAGLTYEGEFSGVSLGLSAVGENQGEGSWYGLGTNVGFGNFTVGGSWGHIEDDYGFSGNDKAADETDTFDLGVSYALDAATVSLSYAYSDYGNGDNTDETGEINTVDLGMRYALGAGVSWRSSIFWAKDEPDGADENEVYGVVTGLRLDF